LALILFSTLVQAFGSGKAALDANPFYKNFMNPEVA